MALTPHAPRPAACRPSSALGKQKAREGLVYANKSVPGPVQVSECRLNTHRVDSTANCAASTPPPPGPCVLVDKAEEGRAGRSGAGEGVGVQALYWL